MPFINKPNFSRDLIIFMISFISSLEIIKVVVPDPNIFLWIAASVAGETTVNPNGIKMLLANGLSASLFKGNAVLLMILKVYLEILLIVLFYGIEFLIILY